MPYIFKGEKAPKKKNLNEKQLLRRKLYNNKKWQRLRKSYLMYHPMCEKCGKLATDVHHINSPFDDGLSDIERLGRLLDVNNFQALCQECHGTLHRKNQKNFNKN
jgi:hypothetical protein